MSALTPSTRLGPYEIVALLGVGGMGEVYRANDTNMKRQVAIKVLPASVAVDADRVARFQREAEVLAALNHPNIAHIHGLEKADETIALVMELVEGPTLAERLADGIRASGFGIRESGADKSRTPNPESRRGLPLDEALPIAKQIAEALEAAHEQGIIHRDLKPANINVRDDGTVKVLDFGLAKAMDPASALRASAGQAGLSMSPTLTTPAMMTGVGMILGTAAYMSPEQAKGRVVDKRSDLWAFGAVLYEMLTGQRAFGGEDVSDTLAHVLMKDPDWTALPANTPAPIRKLLRRCLEKDRKRRLPDAADIRLEIEDALTAPTAELSPAAAVVTAPRRVALLVIASVLGTALVTALATWVLIRRGPPPPPTLTRFAIVPPPSQPLSITVVAADRDLALSPDGTSLVYRAGPAGNTQTQLVVRRLDQLETQALTGMSSGLAAVRGPFFSPDGHWIGFFDNSELKKVSIAGGPAITLCKIAGNSRGASWGDDNTILFATDATTGLMRVPAGGGDPKGLTTPDAAQHEGAHWFPSVLPGGRGVLFTIASGGAENARVAASRSC